MNERSTGTISAPAAASSTQSLAYTHLDHRILIIPLYICIHVHAHVRRLIATAPSPRSPARPGIAHRSHPDPAMGHGCISSVFDDAPFLSSEPHPAPRPPTTTTTTTPATTRSQDIEPPRRALNRRAPPRHDTARSQLDERCHALRPPCAVGPGRGLLACACMRRVLISVKVLARGCIERRRRTRRGGRRSSACTLGG